MPNLLKILKIVYWCSISIEGILFLIFGLPVLGALAAFEFAESIGCTLSAADVNACMFIGMDIGDRLYSYTIPLIGSLLTPIAFFISFLDVLIITNLICLACWLTRRYFVKSSKFFEA